MDIVVVCMKCDISKLSVRRKCLTDLKNCLECKYIIGSLNQNSKNLKKPSWTSIWKIYKKLIYYECESHKLMIKNNSYQKKFLFSLTLETKINEYLVLLKLLTKHAIYESTMLINNSNPPGYIYWSQIFNHFINDILAFNDTFLLIGHQYIDLINKFFEKLYFNPQCNTHFLNNNIEAIYHSYPPIHSLIGILAIINNWVGKNLGIIYQSMDTNYKHCTIDSLNENYLPNNIMNICSDYAPDSNLNLVKVINKRSYIGLKMISILLKMASHIDSLSFTISNNYNFKHLDFLSNYVELDHFIKQFAISSFKILRCCIQDTNKRNEEVCECIMINVLPALNRYISKIFCFSITKRTDIFNHISPLINDCLKSIFVNDLVINSIYYTEDSKFQLDYNMILLDNNFLNAFTSKIKNTLLNQNIANIPESHIDINKSLNSFSAVFKLVETLLFQNKSISTSNFGDVKRPMLINLYEPSTRLNHKSMNELEGHLWVLFSLICGHLSSQNIFLNYNNCNLNACKSTLNPINYVACHSFQSLLSKLSLRFLDRYLPVRPEYHNPVHIWERIKHCLDISSHLYNSKHRGYQIHMGLHFASCYLSDHAFLDQNVPLSWILNFINLTLESIFANKIGKNVINNENATSLITECLGCLTTLFKSKLCNTTFINVLGLRKSITNLNVNINSILNYPIYKNIYESVFGCLLCLLRFIVNLNIDPPFDLLNTFWELFIDPDLSTRFIIYPAYYELFVSLLSRGPSYHPSKEYIDRLRSIHSFKSSAIISNPFLTKYTKGFKSKTILTFLGNFFGFVLSNLESEEDGGIVTTNDSDSGSILDNHFEIRKSNSLTFLEHPSDHDFAQIPARALDCVAMLPLKYLNDLRLSNNNQNTKEFSALNYVATRNQVVSEVFDAIYKILPEKLEAKLKRNRPRYSYSEVLSCINILYIEVQGLINMISTGCHITYDNSKSISYMNRYIVKYIRKLFLKLSLPSISRENLTESDYQSLAHLLSILYRLFEIFDKTPGNSLSPLNSATNFDQFMKVYHRLVPIVSLRHLIYESYRLGNSFQLHYANLFDSLEHGNDTEARINDIRMENDEEILNDETLVDPNVVRDKRSTCIFLLAKISITLDYIQALKLSSIRILPVHWEDEMGKEENSDTDDMTIENSFKDHRTIPNFLISYFVDDKDQILIQDNGRIYKDLYMIELLHFISRSLLIFQKFNPNKVDILKSDHDFKTAIFESVKLALKFNALETNSRKLETLLDAYESLLRYLVIVICDIKEEKALSYDTELESEFDRDEGDNYDHLFEELCYHLLIGFAKLWKDSIYVQNGDELNEDTNNRKGLYSVHNSSFTPDDAQSLDKFGVGNTHKTSIQDCNTIMILMDRGVKLKLITCFWIFVVNFESDFQLWRFCSSAENDSNKLFYKADSDDVFNILNEDSLSPFESFLHIGLIDRDYAVRLAMVKGIVNLFQLSTTPNEPNFASITRFHNVILFLNVVCVSNLKKLENANAKTSLDDKNILEIATFADIFIALCENGNLIRSLAIPYFLIIAHTSQIGIGIIVKTLGILNKRIKFSDNHDFMKFHASSCFSFWLHAGYEITSFPYPVFGCSSLNQFLELYFEKFVPLYQWKGVNEIFTKALPNIDCAYISNFVLNVMKEFVAMYNNDIIPTATKQGLIKDSFKCKVLTPKTVKILLSSVLDTLTIHFIYDHAYQNKIYPYLSIANPLLKRNIVTSHGNHISIMLHELSANIKDISYMKELIDIIDGNHLTAYAILLELRDFVSSIRRRENIFNIYMTVLKYCVLSHLILIASHSLIDDCRVLSETSANVQKNKGPKINHSIGMNFKKLSADFNPCFIKEICEVVPKCIDRFLFVKKFDQAPNPMVAISPHAAFSSVVTNSKLSLLISAEYITLLSRATELLVSIIMSGVKGNDDCIYFTKKLYIALYDIYNRLNENEDFTDHSINPEKNEEFIDMLMINTESDKDTSFIRNGIKFNLQCILETILKCCPEFIIYDQPTGTIDHQTIDDDETFNIAIGYLYFLSYELDCRDITIYYLINFSKIWPFLQSHLRAKNYHSRPTSNEFKFISVTFYFVSLKLSQLLVLLNNECVRKFLINIIAMMGPYFYSPDNTNPVFETNGGLYKSCNVYESLVLELENLIFEEQPSQEYYGGHAQHTNRFVVALFAIQSLQRELYIVFMNTKKGGLIKFGDSINLFTEKKCLFSVAYTLLQCNPNLLKTKLVYQPEIIVDNNDKIEESTFEANDFLTRFIFEIVNSINKSTHWVSEDRVQFSLQSSLNALLFRFIGSKSFYELSSNDDLYRSIHHSAIYLTSMPNLSIILLPPILKTILNTSVFKLNVTTDLVTLQNIFEFFLENSHKTNSELFKGIELGGENQLNTLDKLLSIANVDSSLKFDLRKVIICLIDFVCGWVHEIFITERKFNRAQLPANTGEIRKCILNLMLASSKLAFKYKLHQTSIYLGELYLQLSDTGSDKREFWMNEKQSVRHIVENYIKIGLLDPLYAYIHMYPESSEEKLIIHELERNWEKCLLKYDLSIRESGINTTEGVMGKLSLSLVNAGYDYLSFAFNAKSSSMKGASNAYRQVKHSIEDPFNIFTEWKLDKMSEWSIEDHCECKDEKTGENLETILKTFEHCLFLFHENQRDHLFVARDKLINVITPLILNTTERHSFLLNYLYSINDMCKLSRLSGDYSNILAANMTRDANELQINLFEPSLINFHGVSKSRLLSSCALLDMVIEKSGSSTLGLRECVALQSVIKRTAKKCLDLSVNLKLFSNSAFIVQSMQKIYDKNRPITINVIENLDALRWDIERANLDWLTDDKPSALSRLKKIAETLNSYFVSKNESPFLELRDSNLAKDQDINTKLNNYTAYTLTLCGDWLSEAKLEFPATILSSYYDRAFSFILNKGSSMSARVSHSIAVFADAQYQRIGKFCESDAFERKRGLARDYASLQEVHCKSGLGPSRLSITLRKQNEADMEELRGLETQRSLYLDKALSCYADCLALSDDGEEDDIFRVISLWFANSQNPQANRIMSEKLWLIPVKKWLPLRYQIIARLSLNNDSISFDNTSFVYLLGKLVENMALAFPQLVIYPLLALQNSDIDKVLDPNSSALRSSDVNASSYYNAIRSSNELTNHLQNKSLAAHNLILKLVKKDSKLRDLIADVQKLCVALIEFAYYIIPDYNKKDALTNDKKAFAIPSHLYLHRIIKNNSADSTLNNIVIPICLPADNDISTLSFHNFPRIMSLDSTFQLAGGVNLPKIITCLGSDGIKRKILVKGQDDMRQDAIMQQVFGLVNSLLTRSSSDKTGGAQNFNNLDLDSLDDYKDPQNSLLMIDDKIGSRSGFMDKYMDRPEYRKAKCDHESSFDPMNDGNLSLETYRVIPMSQKSGIVEWCEDTIPLGAYLVGNPRDETSGAHHRYRSHLNDYSALQCRKILTNATDKLSAFETICENFQPVLRNYFYENYSDPLLWYQNRKNYINSVATASIAGYVLGLGDRHVHNILLRKINGKIIHIDLGVAFEQGKLLPTPESVPFRLTRDIVDGMGIFGIEGIFRKNCERVMGILRQCHESLLTIVEVLLYDPLYSWSLSPLQILQKQANNQCNIDKCTIDNDNTQETINLSKIKLPNEKKTSKNSNTKRLRTTRDNTKMSDASLLKNQSTISKICSGEKSTHIYKDVNILAERVIIRMKQKLQGMEEGHLMSIQGQVYHLIREAMDPQNLCRLFPGWQSYI